jgi:hypothetical protein
MEDYEIVNVDLSLLIEIANGNIVSCDSDELEDQKLLGSETFEVSYRFYRDLDGYQRAIPIRFPTKPL